MSTFENRTPLSPTRERGGVRGKIATLLSPPPVATATDLSRGGRGYQVLVVAACLFICPFANAFDFSNLDADKILSGSSKLIKAVAGVSDEDEIKIGRDVAANVAARYHPLEQEGMLRYLNLVGQTVA